MGSAARDHVGDPPDVRRLIRRAQNVDMAEDFGVNEDGVARCPWAATPGTMRDYHDTEWGMPVRGESALFERLTLEAFQSGLSWRVILDKREGFRRAFADFDAETVAEFEPPQVDELMQDAGIVRNRRKIEATVVNARAVLELREAGGLEAFIHSFRPARTPMPESAAGVPTVSEESTALGKALKKHGFTFVGPTTMHALMEAVGLVDTHLLACHRRGSSGLWTAEGAAC